MSKRRMKNFSNNIQEDKTLDRTLSMEGFYIKVLQRADSRRKMRIKKTTINIYNYGH